MDLEAWRALESRIEAEQVPDGVPLLDRLPPEFLEALEPLEALALRNSPEAYLRTRQLPPADLDWLVWVLLTGRGFGKSFAAAGWIIARILEGIPDAPADIALVAPTIDECWSLQWKPILAMLPPWVRYVERVSRNTILFPDEGVSLLMHSAEVTQYRGPNLRAAWLEEPIKFPRGEELWTNLRLAVRVAGPTPPRVVVTTTPPEQIDWVLELCAEDTTRVTRGRMRDNLALDQRAVRAAYRAGAGKGSARRELDGEVVIGADNALFRQDELDRYRVAAAPRLAEIVIAVDPAQSGRKDADTVGLCALGVSEYGHLFVLASCSERLEPADWAHRALTWATLYQAGAYVVEPTGSGSFPRATLEAQMRLERSPALPVHESPARGSKADRASPLSAAAAGGRVHLVGSHRELERELTSWHRGATFSPGALDALVHGAAHLTSNWTLL